jgi:hypothetical protein
VRWEKASMGYYDYQNIKTQQLDWVWHDSALRHPRRELAAGGGLELLSEDCKSSKPVDWFQGVRVIFARFPDTRPDWNKRQDQVDSVWSDCTVQPDGSFCATFDPAQFRRPAGRSARFQVGLSLATKVGRTLTWKNTVPVLPQSVQTIAIPGPPTLSPIQQAINGAPSVIMMDFDPTVLIRAVNRLRALGKPNAIAELRRFLGMARRSWHTERDPENIDTSDEQCVFLIVRLLFEPAEPGDTRPPLFIGAMVPRLPEQDQSLWPYFPLIVQDDIPLLFSQFGGIGGVPEPASDHVDWAEQHGRLRAQPLHPGDDPLRAVDKVLALPQTVRLRAESWGESELRKQAWRMIEPLFVRPPEAGVFWPGRGDDLDADWNKQKGMAASNKIRWDETLQAYTSR